MMRKLLARSGVCATLIVLLAAVTAASAFAAGPAKAANGFTIAYGPTIPPDPYGRLAYGPTIPPDPYGRLAYGPTIPPDPYGRLAYGPTIPPDPYGRLAYGPTIPPDPY